jgi:hypothetical protein
MARRQRVGHADSSSDSKQYLKAGVGNEYFQAALNCTPAANTLRYEYPAPYYRQLINALRLQPASFLALRLLTSVNVWNNTHRVFLVLDISCRSVSRRQ